jgi:hypothetical protein
VTREERIYIDFKDLQGIELTCGHDGCDARVSCSLHGNFKLPLTCPVCNSEWFTMSDDPHRRALSDFSHMLRIVRESQGGKRFKAKLQLHEESVD